MGPQGWETAGFALAEGAAEALKRSGTAVPPGWAPLEGLGDPRRCCHRLPAPVPAVPAVPGQGAAGSHAGLAVGREDLHNKPLAAVREQLSEADGSSGREDKAQPGGRDAGHGQPGRGYGGGWVRGTPVLPGEGMGRGGRGARYLGAVEVTAMRVREPARPAGALVDGHVPQLHVHPHDPSAPRERVSPSRGWRGASPCPPRDRKSVV